MKAGDKVICHGNDTLLEKNVTYIVDHEDMYDSDCVYVRTIDNAICYAGKSEFLTQKQVRKLKLEKLNQI